MAKTGGNLKKLYAIFWLFLAFLMSGSQVAAQQHSNSIPNASPVLQTPPNASTPRCDSAMGGDCVVNQQFNVREYQQSGGHSFTRIHVTTIRAPVPLSRASRMQSASHLSHAAIVDVLCRTIPIFLAIWPQEHSRIFIILALIGERSWSSPTPPSELLGGSVRVSSASSFRNDLRQTSPAMENDKRSQRCFIAAKLES
jgi:hypothetical protein